MASFSINRRNSNNDFDSILDFSDNNRLNYLSPSHSFSSDFEGFDFLKDHQHAEVLNPPLNFLDPSTQQLLEHDNFDYDTFLTFDQTVIESEPPAIPTSSEITCAEAESPPTTNDSDSDDIGGAAVVLPRKTKTKKTKTQSATAAKKKPTPKRRQRRAKSDELVADSDLDEDDKDEAEDFNINTPSESSSSSSSKTRTKVSRQGKTQEDFESNQEWKEYLEARAKNNKAAQESRRAKKQHFQQLEVENSKLRAANKKLDLSNRQLKAENEELLRQLAVLRSL